MPYLLLVLTVLFWSGNFVLGRGVHEAIPPVALAFWRWTGALLILLPFALKPIIQQRRIIWDNLGLLTGLSILSITNFNTFIYLALKSTTVVNTVLVNSMTPIFIFIISWLGFNDRITFRQGVGLGLSFTGLLWIMTQGRLGVLATLRFSAGDLWTLSAALSWALYSILLKKRPAKLHPIGFLATIILIGLIFLAPIYFWEMSTGARMAISPATLWSVLYVALFPSVLSFIFWNKSVGIVGANKAGIFIHLMPVFSIMLAFLFLGEHLKWYHITGIILIFSGIFLTTVNVMGLEKNNPKQAADSD
jgi:drug/metabolite transporter (DMT)-like permease